LSTLWWRVAAVVVAVLEPAQALVGSVLERDLAFPLELTTPLPLEQAAQQAQAMGCQMPDKAMIQSLALLPHLAAGKALAVSKAAKTAWPEGLVAAQRLTARAALVILRPQILAKETEAAPALSARLLLAEVAVQGLRDKPRQAPRNRVTEEMVQHRQSLARLQRMQAAAAVARIRLVAHRQGRAARVAAETAQITILRLLVARLTQAAAPVAVDILR
jgi:hypothetical protein